MITYVLLELTHPNPIPDLGERAANYVYTIQGLDDCELVGEFTDKAALLVAVQQGEAKHEPRR